MCSNAEPTPCCTREIVRKTAYHHGDLRQALLEAARQLINEKGPEAFSVAEACQLAGVSTAAPYKHFKDKNAILEGVLLEEVDRRAASIKTVLAPYPPGHPDRIIALARDYVDFAMAEPGLFTLRFGSSGRLWHSELVRTRSKALYEVVTAELASCLGESTVTDDVRQRSFMMWSLLHGLTSLMKDAYIAEDEIDFDIDALVADAARRILA